MTICVVQCARRLWKSLWCLNSVALANHLVGVALIQTDLIQTYNMILYSIQQWYGGSWSNSIDVLELCCPGKPSSLSDTDWLVIIWRSIVAWCCIQVNKAQQACTTHGLLLWQCLNAVVPSWNRWVMQERHNSIANALELRLSCTNPWKFSWRPLGHHGVCRCDSI